jgi:hypothetical protein
LQKIVLYCIPPLGDMDHRKRAQYISIQVYNSPYVSAHKSLSRSVTRFLWRTSPHAHSHSPVETWTCTCFGMAAKCRSSWYASIMRRLSEPFLFVQEMHPFQLGNAPCPDLYGREYYILWASRAEQIGSKMMGNHVLYSIWMDHKEIGSRNGLLWLCRGEFWIFWSQEGSRQFWRACSPQFVSSKHSISTRWWSNCPGQSQTGHLFSSQGVSGFGQFELRMKERLKLNSVTWLQVWRRNWSREICGSLSVVVCWLQSCRAVAHSCTPQPLGKAGSLVPRGFWQACRCGGIGSGSGTDRMQLKRCSILIRIPEASGLEPKPCL